MLLALATIVGVLNANKAHVLRVAAVDSEAARQRAERAHAAKEKEMKALEATVTAKPAKSAENETTVASAEDEIVKSQMEKASLQDKLQADEAQIADLQKRIEQGSPNAVPAGEAAPPTAELQAQLQETKRRLDAAEREKALLSDKISASQERSPQIEPEKRRRVASNPSLRGTVLAVNQAYNFVVLNLGGRQGVEPNSEMLVLRGGALIGKIRVSSVEPFTAIGDIISTSLPRGVQVQPGDTVIYAGSNS